MFAVQASDQLASARLQQHLDLMTMGAWESGSWKPASGCSLGATMCPRHRQQGKWWVHVVGDSVARFVFAAWLSALNGTVRDAQFPRHEMSGVPLCSFAAVTNNGTKPQSGVQAARNARLFTLGHAPPTVNGLAVIGRRTQV